MRPILMMTAAVLLACVAYSHQQLVATVADKSDEDGEGDVPSSGQQVLGGGSVPSDGQQALGGGSVPSDGQQELGGGSVPSDGQQEMQEANGLRGGGKRPKQKKKPKNKPIISHKTIKQIGKTAYKDFAKPVLQQIILGQVSSTLATALDELPDAVTTTPVAV